MRNGMEFALNMSLQWGLEMLWGARLERNGSTPSYVHLYAGRSIADKFEGRGHGMTVSMAIWLALDCARRRSPVETQVI